MVRHVLLALLAIAALLMFLAGCGDNAFSVFSDEDSEAACKHELSTNLDQGKYAEVLESSCAENMDRGAAYFGLAGYGLTDISEKIMDASDADTDEDSFDVYMSNLIMGTSKNNFTNIDNAKSEYTKVPVDSKHYKDARFYINELIGPVKGMTVIKGLLDPDGDGIISQCDINANSTIDEADAVSCALLTVGGQNCASVGAGAAAVSPLTFANYPGTYTGLKVTIIGTPTPDCPSPAEYRKLLDSTNTYVVATTSEQCAGSDGGIWPCPYVVNNQPVGFVEAIDEALAETGVIDDELRTDICGIDLCTSDEVSNYIQNMN